jgi:predicted SprT family Zn-dependent metalloprotease
LDPDRAIARLWSELRRHGLAERGWVGRFDRARCRFGCCWMARREISLSLALTELNDEAQVVDTILHEVAHALAFERYGHGVGHDARWKAIAAQLGATPRACTGRDRAQMLDGKFFLVHRNTFEVFRSYQRRPRRRGLDQIWIGGRKAETYGQLILVDAEHLGQLGVSAAKADL